MAMGMTDVDDKIIQRAHEEKRDFRSVAHSYEASFIEDLQNLNVQAPACYLRVSEHIQEIIDYIQQIKDNGYAYIIDKPASQGGGVYFDVKAFNDKFRYGKLRALQEDADEFNDLSLSGKRSAADFALWKKLKEGEPSWDSPFGPGRPGWHIECSAVASRMFGSHLDVHTGGVDLVFPHHNNEIAQCEAYFQKDSWASYWLHSGHVKIKGEKMSKSLRNFVTIKDFLADHTADQFRMWCLQHKYHSNVDFHPERMEQAKAALEKVEGLLHRIQELISGQSGSGDPQRPQMKRWCEVDKALFDCLLQTKVEVNQQLARDLDTPAALKAVFKLIARTNQALSSSDNVSLEVLESIGNFLSSLLQTLGFTGIRSRSKAGRQASSSWDKAGPEVMQALADFRSFIRQTAISSKKQGEPGVSAVDLLKECDRIRDQVLPEAGIELKDQSLASSRWQLKG